MMMPGEAPFIAFSLVGLATVAGWLLRPVVVGLGRRLEGKGTDAALEAEVAELRDRLQELESVQLRLAELEDRQEFTERLLAGTRDNPRIEGRAGPGQEEAR